MHRIMSFDDIRYTRSKRAEIVVRVGKNILLL